MSQKHTPDPYLTALLAHAARVKLVQEGLLNDAEAVAYRVHMHRIIKFNWSGKILTGRVVDVKRDPVRIIRLRIRLEGTGRNPMRSASLEDIVELIS